jgi:hypothetical protein
LLAFPDLLAEWDYEANEIEPGEASLGSAVRHWWHCARGHRWQARLPDRRKGTGCPYCTGRLASPDHNLAVIAPDVAAEWHPTLNDRDPTTVLPQANRLYWWLCERNHAWQAKPNNRVSSNRTGCPYCAGQRSSPEYNLAIIEPSIAAEWHPTRNDCAPDEVTPQSNKLRWWRCAAGHEWRTSPANRVGRRSDCPACVDDWTLPAFQAWLAGQVASQCPAAWADTFDAIGMAGSRSAARVVAAAIERGLFHPEEIEAFSLGGLELNIEHLLNHPLMRDLNFYRPTISDVDRHATFARDGHRCQLCDSTERLEIDHFIAVSRGGRSVITNYWTLCCVCNRSKGARAPTSVMVACWLATGRAIPTSPLKRQASCR